MKQITLEFSDNLVIVSDGTRTDVSPFSDNIKDEEKRGMIALANFFGYEPAYLLNFDDGTFDLGFEDFDEEDF